MLLKKTHKKNTQKQTNKQKKHTKINGVQLWHKLNANHSCKQHIMEIFVLGNKITKQNKTTQWLTYRVQLQTNSTSR